MSAYTGSPKYHYTPQPEAGEIVSQIIGLSGITIMSALFGIKTYNIQYKYLSYSKWLVISLYFCSWAFTVSGLNLVYTNNGKKKNCMPEKKDRKLFVIPKNFSYIKNLYCCISAI